jgi:hypothetical protein
MGKFTNVSSTLVKVTSRNLFQVFCVECCSDGRYHIGRCHAKERCRTCLGVAFKSEAIHVPGTVVKKPPSRLRHLLIRHPGQVRSTGLRTDRLPRGELLGVRSTQVLHGPGQTNKF